MKEKYCSKCGKKVQSNLKFCTSCGGKAVERDTSEKQSLERKKEEGKSSIKGIKICKKCGSKNSQKSNFCVSCGSKLESSYLKCPSCGTLCSEKLNFCLNCGASLKNTSKINNSKTNDNPKLNNPNSINNPNNINPANNNNSRKINSQNNKNTTPKKNHNPKKKKRFLPTVAIFLVIIFTGFFALKLKDFIGDFRSVDENDNLVIDDNDNNYERQPKPELGETIAEEILSSENLTIEAENEGVKMVISSYCLENESTATIKKVSVQSPEENIEMNAYDLTIDTDEELDGLIKIEIPYDPSKIPEGMTAEEVIGAAYYNEEKGYWEPTYHELDTERNLVIIKTDHLCSWAEYNMKNGNFKGYGGEGNRLGNALNIPKEPDFGIFHTTNKFSVTEKAFSYDLSREKLRTGLTDNNEVLKEIALYGMDASSKVKTDFALKMIGDTSSTIGGGTTLLNVTVYKRVWSEALGNSLSGLGSRLVLAQLASDIYQGKTAEETLWSLFKGTVYSYGPTVAKHLIGAGAVPIVEVGLVGLFAYELVFGPIDSPIPKWKDYYVHEKAFQAYYEYYHSSPKRGGNYHSNDYWQKRIEELNNLVVLREELPEGYNNKGEYLKFLIRKDLEFYSKEFWSLDEDTLTKKLATTEGSGVFGNYDRVYFLPDKDNHNVECANAYVKEILANQYPGLREEMEQQFLNELVKDRLQPMMDEMREEIMTKREKELNEYFGNLQNVLNSKITLQVYDEGKKMGKKSAYAGYSIYPKSTSINPDFKNQWLKTIDDSGNATLEFTMLAHQRAGAFTELELYKPNEGPITHKPVGTIKFEIGEKIIKIPLKEKKESQYTWVLVETISDPFEQSSIKNGQCISAYTKTDDSIDPIHYLVKGDSYSATFTWTPLKESYMPEEEVVIEATGKFTEYNTDSTTILAWLEFGILHNVANEGESEGVFFTKNDADSYSLNLDHNKMSGSETFSMTMPTIKSENDTLTIVCDSHGKAKFIYKPKKVEQ